MHFEIAAMRNVCVIVTKRDSRTLTAVTLVPTVLPYMELLKQFQFITTTHKDLNPKMTSKD